MNICKTSRLLAQKALRNLCKQLICPQQQSNYRQQQFIATKSLRTSGVPQGAALRRQILKQSYAKASSAAMVFDPLEDEEIITICRPCSSNDRETMIDFMSKLFISREPLVRSLGATPRNAKKYVSYCVDEALDHQASFIALDGETEEVLGLRLNAIGPADQKELRIDFGPEVNAVPKFLHDIENGIDEVLGTEKYMRHVAICVQQSASQCGIATDLMRLSLKHAKKEQLRFMTAMCSWKLPFKLASKMGYSLLREMSYKQYAISQPHLSAQQQQGLLALAEAEEKARVLVKKIR